MTHDAPAPDPAPALTVFDALNKIEGEVLRAIHMRMARILALSIDVDTGGNEKPSTIYGMPYRKLTCKLSPLNAAVERFLVWRLEVLIKRMACRGTGVEYEPPDALRHLRADLDVADAWIVSFLKGERGKVSQIGRYRPAQAEAEYARFDLQVANLELGELDSRVEELMISTIDSIIRRGSPE